MLLLIALVVGLIVVAVRTRGRARLWWSAAATLGVVVLAMTIAPYLNGS
jgi:hypothetical protein